MLELFTFSLSHFSEKIRWSLDASAIAYRETRWTPFFHVLPALLRGRLGTTVPILKTPLGTIQDSTRILLWLEQHEPRFTLLPTSPELRAEALDVEARFDRIGSYVIRYAYSSALEDPASLIKVWTLDANAVQKRIVAAAFPLMRAALRNRYRIAPEHVERARTNISEALDFLDQRLADGRRYLIGDVLTAADITAASLLAPLVCPDQHPVYRREDFRATVAPLVRDWTGRPAFQWVRERYREDRLRPGQLPRACDP